MVLAALLVALSLVPADACGQCARQRTAPDLFYNHYVAPGACGGVGAQLYLSPLPTPPLVGHTYYTYQPLMPHEFLYHHHRKYYRQHPNGGWTRTLVWWQ
jgi:hypothetical protein